MTETAHVTEDPNKDVGRGLTAPIIYYAGNHTRVYIEGDIMPKTYECFDLVLQALLANTSMRGVDFYTADIADPRFFGYVERFAMEHEVDVYYEHQITDPPTHQVVFMDQASIGRYKIASLDRLVKKPTIVIISSEGSHL